MTRRPPLLALALAGVLSVGTSILPQALAPAAPDAIRPLLAAVDAPVVRAAAGLAIRTKTTYVVDPGDGVIRVTVDIDATNEKPNSDVGGVTTRYYYDGLNLGVQPEARNIRASDGGR